MSQAGDDAARDERHRVRMRRKQEVVDGRIAAADGERGVLLVLTYFLKKEFWKDIQ